MQNHRPKDSARGKTNAGSQRKPRMRLEPDLLPQTWVRCRLLELLCQSGPPAQVVLDEQLAMCEALVWSLSRGRDEPLADVLQANLCALGIAWREGIRLADVLEKRASALSQMILAHSPGGETPAVGPAGAGVAMAPSRAAEPSAAKPCAQSAPTITLRSTGPSQIQ